MIDIIFLILALAISAFIISTAFKAKPSHGSSSLILFTAAVAMAALVNFCLPFAPTSFLIFLFAILILGINLAHLVFLTFVIQYSGHGKLLTPAVWIILSIEPLLIQVLLWTNPGTKFFSSNFTQVLTHPIASQNPWLLVDTMYTNILLLGAITFLLWDFSFRALAKRHQSIFFLAGLAVAILLNNDLSAAYFLPLPVVMIIPLIALGIGLICGLIFTRTHEITTVARESVVEHMKDGWLVLDMQNRIVDINAAAEKIVGQSRNSLAGQPAEQILVDWPNLMNSLSNTRELDFKGSARLDSKWYYLNIHKSPLIDADSHQFGTLIVWRDNTGQRVAEETRQQARDEMFILLHSITSAASRALNQDDFLSESIYQIVYSSHSNAIAIYLLEEQDTPEHDSRLVLAAQHGLPTGVDGNMSSVPASLGFVKWVLENGKPLLIPDIKKDTRVPLPMRELGHMSLLLLPMQMEGHSLGIIGVTRSVSPPYNPDEIARLSAVADEIATFIQSNRLRQLSIALSERQRLVRDLHDSVTQQLYGLVQLAEGARAGLQAGDTDAPVKMIPKMADNARQALKEMRLFLFQMQPVDFEHDGLVSVLKNRLSAVEGRANTNASLTVDEDYYLPMEKELALYFIAQEALNNVLKHARARNIDIYLKSNRASVILEIEDDGCGFDPKSVSSGGIGMRSMRERASQIGAKLKISSAPGNGTKVTVALKKNGWMGG